MREKFRVVIDKFQYEIEQIENQFPELPKKKFFDKESHLKNMTFL